MGWGFNQNFTGRTMMLHLGAFTATIMTANVFFIIMSNQRIIVDDLMNGRIPRRKSNPDLGGYGTAVQRHHVAIHRADVQTAGRGQDADAEAL